MKRVLMLASVASMIAQFNMPNIELLQNMGFQVDVACNFMEGNSCSEEELEDLKRRLEQLNIRYFQIDFSRKMRRFMKNGKAYRQIKQLLKENQYEFVHCHSPIGGVVGRLAAKRTETKVIYTAHGFHFYNGASAINWLIYYPVEKFLSRWTNILITINYEDYQCAKDHFHMKKLEYIPGVGVDVEKFSAHDFLEKNKRAELQIPAYATWILSVGELIKRKNHETLIRAIAGVDNVYLTIAGQGELKDHLLNLIDELGVSDRVKLLGYRSDVSDLCKESDIFAFPSLLEGLSLALMEAMASGKPVICSRIRGNTDLIQNGKGGYLCAPRDADAFAAAICELLVDKDQWLKMGQENQRMIQGFTSEKVNENMEEIYSEVS